MISLNGVTLPNGLQWVNEFSQQKVSMTTHRTLAGSTVVYHGTRSNGMPIHIESGTDYGWVKRNLLKQIQLLANQAGLIMTLSLKGESFNVMFDHSQGSALEATPLVPMANPTDEDYYRIKLSFITV